MLLSTVYRHCETRLTDWMFARPGFFLVGIFVGCNGADRLPKPRRPRLRSTSSSRSSRPPSPTSRRPVLSRTSPCVSSLYQPGSYLRPRTLLKYVYVLRVYHRPKTSRKPTLALSRLSRPCSRRASGPCPVRVFLISALAPSSTASSCTHVAFLFTWAYRLQGEVRRPLDYVEGVIFHVVVGAVVAG